MPATYAASTELDAVNQILSSVGQAPVTTLDLQNPEVSIVLSTLREVNRQVQSEGWLFNTERGYEFTPDAVTGFIEYPTNVIALDTTVDDHGGTYDPVRRDGKMYDRLEHTFVWTDPIKCDVTWFFAYEDVPPPIQVYITARAARLVAVKLVGDKEIYSLLQEQELYTRAAALEYDCNQGDYSIFGWRDGQGTYTSYQPYHALTR